MLTHRLLGAALLVSASLPAYAGTCEPRSDAEVSARLQAVEGIFEDHAPAMNLWWTGFVGLHASMAAGMSVVQNYQSEHARQETAVGIVGSALGAATLFLVTPPIIERERRLGPTPQDDPTARRRYLAAAERLLEAQANKTRFAQSWLARGIAFAYTTGAAIFVWLALDRPLGAVRNFVGGLVIGQGRILLHPSGAAEAYAAYRERYAGPCGAEVPAARRRPPADVGPKLGFAGGPRGLALTLTF